MFTVVRQLLITWEVEVSFMIKLQKCFSSNTKSKNVTSLVQLQCFRSKVSKVGGLTSVKPVQLPLVADCRKPMMYSLKARPPMTSPELDVSAPIRIVWFLLCAMGHGGHLCLSHGV